MLSSLIHVQYCYDYLINQISIGLLLYAHLPAAIISLFFGGYLLYKTKKLESVTLFIVCVSFSIWCFLSISTWFAFLGSSNTMFTWSLIDVFALAMFFFSYYFLYSFITKNDLPMWQKVIGVGILLPTIIWTFLGSNLTAFNGNYCEAIENEFVVAYPYYAEAIYLLSVIILTIVEYRKITNKTDKREILLAGLGVSIFLFFFCSATLLVNILVNNDLLSGYAYNFEIYGLFGMPLLLIFLGYLVVKYKAFDLKVFTSQALVVILIVFVGSQFAFLQDFSSIILNAVTLVLVAWIGLSLIRNVRKEIEAKEKIEKLASDLESANTGQERFIHFLSHEIKGYLSIAKDGFASIVEGDYGIVAPSLTTMAGNALQRMTDGVDTVQNILTSANLKSGNMTFNMASFDLRKSVVAVAKMLAQKVIAKGLTLEVHIDDSSDYTIVGDQDNISRHVILNLIDNAINYTLKGKIEIGLSKDDSSVLFTVKDSGVGITEEDKKKLFTEGGRGKDSTKVNAHSTGHGLFIAKNIVAAHKGKIWAESAGQDMGTTFFVELPIK